jgi:AAA domain-containing protein
MMTKEQAQDYFPTKVTTSKPHPNRLKYLIMAPPKWGKTTLFAGVPNSLLLAFEEGHMFASTFKVVINGWDVPIRDRGPMEDDETGIKYATAMEIVEALEVYNPFSFISIDTLDVLCKMCSEYECKKAGLQHPSDGGDWGKGWDLYQTAPVRRYYNRLAKLGVGVAAITHVKEEWKKDKFGVERYTRETSLPGGVQKFVHNTSDMILNGIWGRRRKGMHDRDRIISFDATNEIMAGTRVQGIYIPNKYVVDRPTEESPAASWLQLAEFFENSPAAGKAAEAQYNKFAPAREVANQDDNEEPESESESESEPSEKKVDEEIVAAKTEELREQIKAKKRPAFKGRPL